MDIDVDELATPLFHGFAHKAACQMEYNPKNKDGFRLADGENTERLWSELSRLTSITKEMSPSNRQDLISDALIHRGEKILHSIGRCLLSVTLSTPLYPPSLWRV